MSHWIHIKIHSKYIRIHVSWILHHDTSGMYTARYKITIHASWTRHDDTSGYNQDTSRYMYLGRFVRAALDTHKIRSRYTADTFRIRILDSFYLILSYLACIHSMYPACILITSEDTCIPHVSCMCSACLLHIRYISLDEFEIHVHVHVHVSHYMYVSWMYPTCISITLADTCIPHVSRMYLASCII